MRNITMLSSFSASYESKFNAMCIYWLFQFFNSLCTNLPRRYVLPLDVKEEEPNDLNLINLPYTTATAVKTLSGVREQEVERGD